MGAPIIGRTECPECGFASAHVKKSEKCHFRYCPECGSQHHARTPRQVSDLLAKMRADAPTPSESAPAPAADLPAAVPPTPTLPTPSLPTASDAEASPTPTPKPARKRIGLF